MPDQHADEALAASIEDLPGKLGGSLASVWARYAGSRPEGARVELEGNVVRWFLADGTDVIEAGISADAGTDPPRTMFGFRHEISAAVSKATHRRVMAAISKQDSKTGAATETFILEVAPKRY